MNKTLLIGHLGKDVELRYSQNGIAVATVSLATNEEWTNKTTGQKEKRTDWHRLVAFGKIAENLATYMSKGSKLLVEGKLRTRTYEKDGITRWITEVEVMHTEYLSFGKKDKTPVNQESMECQEQYVGTTYTDDDIPF